MVTQLNRMDNSRLLNFAFHFKPKGQRHKKTIQETATKPGQNWTQTMDSRITRNYRCQDTVQSTSLEFFHLKLKK